MAYSSTTSASSLLSLNPNSSLIFPKKPISTHSIPNSLPKKPFSLPSLSFSSPSLLQHSSCRNTLLVYASVKLSDYIAKKYVILIFYSLDFTFVCPTEITAFSDRHAEFDAINTEILGISVDSVGIALRGLFIIDKEGVIQHSTINNLAIGRSVDETKRTLQTLQYVQENPDEVCPAGWKPGEKSMKPDLKLSKEYFAAV